MPTALVTGANRGIGLEFVRQYAGEGWRVHAACRAPAAAKDLKTIAGDVALHKLDVADAEEIAVLAEALKGEPIDLLINNAGIYGARGDGPGHMDYEAWEETLRINTIAPLRVSEALLPNVVASEQKRIVALTSRMASIELNREGGSYAYRSSKAALNAAMRGLAADLRRTGAIVVVLSPGWVSTDMGGRGAPVRVADSVAGMRAVIAKLRPADSGKFLDYEGGALPW